ncbi:aminotransferase class I/II-fold pyridoxal phosphate-dependent enzyme [Streptomyces sp. YC537]|uniref:Aminotransferase class I/II-fold pyridoxal phosphate-dependent enzyme n=2 Tax=Streptomyces boluensis TaxID=1775135 RepID=A0A964XMB2_9ACTN|nr:aminotransferase class I/II-fold pyridoxal phosphate-dependent enzyme [Streptomyces boluensis]
MQVVRSMDSTDTLGSRRLAGLLTATAGDRPGYRALAQGVRTLLLDGRIALRTRLPAERELATALGVSRATVTAAYDLLRTDGFAHSRRGSGTWTALPDGRRPSSVAAFTDEDDVIDLALAAPYAPQDALRAAFDAVSGGLARHAATAGYHPYGLPELRAAVARRFTRRGLPTLPEQILITSGAQQAVSLTLAVLGRPGDRVMVENPSYATVLDAVRRGGLRAVPVPVTDEGWDAEVAESALRQTAPRLAYMVPDFHNPTGHLMPVEQRLRLLDTVRRTGTWMIVDETLTDIALDVPAPTPFTSLAGRGTGEQLVTVGSLSKTHWGGLRIGWVRAGSQMITELATHRVPTDIATSTLDQLVAVELVERTESVLAERLPLLREQRAALTGALAEQLPEWRWQLPPGGLCLWVDLGAPVSSALATAALDHGVRIEGGARFGADPGTHQHRLRIPYALPAEVCVEAVRRLAATMAAGLPTAAREHDRTRHWVA